MNAIAQGVSDQIGYGQDRNWHACIKLEFAARHKRTALTDMEFNGPLRVQRPFYPEADTCHTYLLHPPGGMVSGDTVDIKLRTGPQSHALVTTPSAGKVYKADSAGLKQKQTLDIRVRDSICEWLPQETILFNGAKAQFDAQVRVEGSGHFTGWEMMALGRAAGDQPFERGLLSQKMSILLNGNHLVWEAFRLDSELSMLNSRVGLNGFSHFGNLYWVGSDIHQHRAALDAALTTLPSVAQQNLLVVASHKPDLLVVRGFSDCAEKLRNSFIQIWAQMRPVTIGKPACLPRIWAT